MMPAFLDRNLSDSSSSIHIGLLNNMPDAALEATERQFLRLLDSASGHRNVVLSLYSLPGIPRTDAGQRHYRSLEELFDTHLDGLIVTGAEPRHSNLTQEPYWKDLTKVVDWAWNNTLSTIWSCLAAHAAVLHMDGIGRHRLDRKCFGVFRCAKVSDDDLTEGLPPVVSIPHSRWHDVREDDLARRGYRILTRASNSPDTFMKPGKSLFVFLQGHPEYDANTLLLEYRRDVRRYLSRESDTYPLPPCNYLDRDTLAAPTLQSAIPKTWEATGIRIYRNWLRHLNAAKMTLMPDRDSCVPALAG